eukprot:GFUD01129637.1.p1 GENE.GFUD01129637.1~~GFUD01129637.1.p1  ORF type:complete len:350 (-),score=82.60 GFUD01129637.1:81-1130(-)
MSWRSWKKNLMIKYFVIRKLSSSQYLHVQEVDGPVNIRKLDDTIFEGNYDNGVPHGYFRHLNDFGDLEFFGCFFRGTLVGLCWKSLPGGGFLISRSWDFSDSNMIYLYPDCRTGLVGSFQGCELKAAQPCEVMSCARTVADSVPVPLMSRPSGDIYTFDPASPAVFCRAPSLPDPYESLFVEVKPSQIKDAGEGLFAKINIDVGTVISFYNGVRVRSGHDWEKPTPYKMVLDETSDIDLPENMTSLENYRATLGHKVCHCFEPNCETDVFFHPRFGLIRCIATIDNIKAGEEILINYGYNLSYAPTWYKVAWAKHQKVVRGLPDWKTALFMNNIQLGSRRESWLSDYNA